MADKSEYELRADDWSKRATLLLAGKTIERVEYLSVGDVDANGWYNSPPVIVFTDGTHVFPMSDDEGNDGGALATSDDGLPTIPVI